MNIKKLCISAITILVATIFLFGCSSKNSKNETITLDAQVSKDSTYLYIKNKDDFVWDKAQVTINSDYIYKSDFLAKGESSLMLTEFTKSDGERFNSSSKKIMKVTIYVPKSEDRKDGFWTGEFN